MDETIQRTKADSQVSAGPPPDLTMRQTQENLQFGAVAIKLGLCSLDQVDECLRLQQRMKGLGVAPKQVGELLLEKGFLRPPHIEVIARYQAQRVAPLRLPGYRVLSRIGQGSMGAIFKAVQVSMDRPVALKILAPKYAENARFVERFFREARAVARLNHPNIIQGIDVGEAEGVHYFAMEFVDGRTVGDMIRRGGALDEKRALHIIIQVARALSHAWQSGLLHRDIKPDNIMITRDGVAKLCDLGLAKVLGGGEDPSATNPGASLGTPYYISPEQARGEKDIDIRTDLYSLGATFHHMVVGDVPFPGDNAAVVITKHLTETPPSARARNPLVSQALDAVLLKMMDRERARRHQTPDDLLRDLEALPREPGIPPPSDNGAREAGLTRGPQAGTRRRSRLRRRFR